MFGLYNDLQSFCVVGLVILAAPNAAPSFMTRLFCAGTQAYIMCEWLPGTPTTYPPHTILSLAASGPLLSTSQLRTMDPTYPYNSTDMPNHTQEGSNPDDVLNWIDTLTSQFDPEIYSDRPLPGQYWQSTHGTAVQYSGGTIQYPGGAVQYPTYASHPQYVQSGQFPQYTQYPSSSQHMQYVQYASPQPTQPHASAVYPPTFQQGSSTGQHQRYATIPQSYYDPYSRTHEDEYSSSASSSPPPTDPGSPSIQRTTSRSSLVNQPPTVDGRQRKRVYVACDRWYA